jgi:alanine racemase
MEKPTTAANLTAWAEIDMRALKHNFMQVKKLAGNRKIIPVIKANAYGHGIHELCRFFTQHLKTEYVGVARVNEGADLRECGQAKANIIILGGFFKGEAGDIIKYRLEPSVFSIKEAVELNSFAGKAGKKVNVHLKINTGMNRLGVRNEQAAGFMDFIKKLPNINLKSIYTHFADSDVLGGDEFTILQTIRLAALKCIKPKNVFMHAANSAAITRFPFSYFDAVRPGIMLYGSYSDKSMKKLVDLKPVMTLKSRVLHTARLKKGDRVSYGGLYKAKGKEKIAIVGIGYGDGFRRDLTGKGWHVLVKGRKAEVIGRVCMDMTAIKTKSNVAVGDEVMIFGRDKYGSIDVEDMAKKIGTISYEIFTGITDRVTRIYRY